MKRIIDESEFLKDFVDFYQRKGLTLCEFNEENKKYKPSVYDGGTGNVENLVCEFLASQGRCICGNRGKVQKNGFVIDCPYCDVGRKVVVSDSITP